MYHLLAFVAGFILDLIIGDPYNVPHPVRWIGSLIGWLDKKLLGAPGDAGNGPAGHEPADKERAASKSPAATRMKGFIMALIVILVTAGVSALVLYGAYLLHPAVGVAIEAVLTCYCLATKSLRVESMRVHDALKTGDLEASRRAVSMIVGRDTASLDEAGIARAAVETVAENTSDGVIAPLIYTCIGGPVLGMTYKAINTMDSMVGYHNGRYENFGFFPAHLDDVVNFIPARLSALLMIASCIFLGPRYSAAGAFGIFKRDRYNHKSPNSAQTESACAGALGLRLAGDASYFGKIVKKPYIGDDTRAIETEDIRRANNLMQGTAILAFVLCVAALAAIGVLC